MIRKGSWMKLDESDPETRVGLLVHLIGDGDDGQVTAE